MQICNLKEVPQHIETLASWHQQEWHHLNPGQTLAMRIQKMQKYLNKDFVPSTFVALDKNIMGSAAIVDQDMDERSEFSPWLASVYVEPAYRCKGIGTALVNHVVEQAKLKGYRELFLYTPDKDKFYQQRGWHCLERTAYHGHDVSIMVYHYS